MSHAPLKRGVRHSNTWPFPGRLALVEVELVPGALLQGADLAANPDAKLVLRAPGMPEELQVLAAPCCVLSV